MNIKQVLAILIFFTYNSLISQTLINTELDGISGFASKGNYLYVIDNDTILRIDTTTSNLTYNKLSTKLKYPNKLAIRNNEIYISSFSDNKILKINITNYNNGKPLSVVTVVENLKGLEDIAFKDEYLYIIEKTEDKISKINVTEATPTPMDVITGLTNPRSITFKGDELYISEYDDNKVIKINVTEATPTPIDAITGLNNPHILTFNGSDLYVYNDNNNTISKIDITATTPATTNILTNIDNVNDIAVQGNSMYFIEITDVSTKKSSIKMYDLSTKTWTGTINSNWEEGGNWTDDSVPTATDYVKIPSGTPIIGNSLDVVINNIVIDKNATLNINDGAFQVKNKARGNITYNRTLPNTSWYLMSSPITKLSYDNDFVDDNNIDSNGSNLAIASYETHDDNWSYVQKDTRYPFILGKGYAFKRRNKGKLSFSGALNTGDVEIAINSNSKRSKSSEEFSNKILRQIRLNITNNSGISRNIIVLFYYLHTKGYDNGGDGGVFRGSGSGVGLQLYSLLLEENIGDMYQVQSLPEVTMGTTIVPLGLISEARKTITFSLDYINLPENYKIEIEDKVENSLTRLDEANAEYTFDVEEAIDGTGRFYLHITQDFFDPVNGNGFYLLGNPYTYYISSSDFLTNNAKTFDNETVWLWNQETDNYDAKVSIEDFKIAPTQGFFVKAKIDSIVNYKASYRVSSTGGFFQKTDKSEIKLKITDGTSKRQARILYFDDATKGFDNGGDGEVFGGQNNDLEVYTHLLEDNKDKKYQVQSLPKPYFQKMVVPIGIKATEVGKEITFSVETLNLPSGTEVILEDRKTEVFTSLTQGEANYKFTLTENLDGVGRFYLHTKTTSVLSENKELINDKIDVYKVDNSTLRVIGLKNEKFSIKLYNILGKRLINKLIEANGKKDISIPNLITGVYIARIETEDSILTKKISF